MRKPQSLLGAARVSCFLLATVCMEAASALGAAASVVGIVDIITRSLLTLHDIRKCLQEADFTLNALIGELETAQSALKQLQALIEEPQDDIQHYQLTLDLGCSLKYCHLLVSFIDERISKLERVEGSNTTKFLSRVKIVLDDRETTNCLERLSRSMVSINLNIDAYKCRSPELQRELLNNRKRRRIFDDIRDDTSSLIVMCGSGSTSAARTNTTTATSRLSWRLPGIDEQLLRTDAYKKLFGGLIRRAKESQKTAISSSPLTKLSTTSGAKDIERKLAKEADAKNKQINKDIAEDSRRRRREARILVLGDQDYAAKAVRRIKDVLDGGRTEERKLYLPQILNYTMASMRNLLDAMSEHEAQWADHELEPFVRTLRDAAAKPQELHLSEEVMEAIQTLLPVWERIGNYSDVSVDAFLEPTLHKEPQSYFLDQFHRIAVPDYIPSEEDIERLLLDQKPSITETKCAMKDLEINFIQVHQSGRRKWISNYDTVLAIFFVVDASCYNQNATYGPPETKLAELLIEFDSISNSKWFVRAGIFLLLQYDSKELEAQLEVDPLSNYFSDIEDNDDLRSVTEFILSLFVQRKRDQSSLYCEIAESTDPQIARFVLTSTSSFIRATSLQNAGLIE